MGTSLNPAQPPSAAIPAGTQSMGTVAQTLAILRFLSAAPRPMGVNGIARELGIAPSSCFKVLKYLCEDGFAQFDDATKCYTLGGAAIMLARRALDPGNTYSFVRPTLLEFASNQEVSVCFWRRIDRQRIVLAGFIESPNPLRIHMSIGQGLPLFMGAVGRAFAAELGLSKTEIERELAQLRWQSPPSSDEYYLQVEHYRSFGFTIDQNNFAPGVTTVATILKDAEGAPNYGITAIRLSAQMSDVDISRVGKALVDLKQTLIRNFFSPN